MKNLFFSLFVSGFIFLLIPTRTYAVMGGELTYKCLGNGRYTITARIYRDCNAGTITNVPVTATPLTGSASPTTLYLSQYSVIDITANGCSSLQSKCAGGSFAYGIEEYLYAGTLDLSSYTSSCKFRISWQYCCRSGGITTGMSTENLYLETILDKCLSSCNSSPQFTRRPEIILCANVDYIFNNGIIDTIDGDSISYSLVDALLGTGSSNTYGSGFDKYRPLTFLGTPNYNAILPNGFHLDEITGDLRFRPTKTERGVVVVKATEWRKISGVMTNIGEVRRDMEFIVVNCTSTSNNTPTIYSPVSYEVCAGTKLCFDIQAVDGDAADTVRITWNKGIPGATFTPFLPSGSKKEKGTFCWTPTDNDVSIYPYNFSAILKDNFCPQPAAASKTFSILVKPTLKNSGRVFSNMGCGKVLFTATPANGFSNYKWTIRKSAVDTLVTDSNYGFFYVFPAGGKYFVDLEENRAGYCGLKYRDTVNVDTFLAVTLPPDTTLCRGSNLTINSLVSSGRKPYRYQWNSSTNDTLPALNLTLTATKNYYLTVTDSGHCAVSDTVKVTARTPFVNAGNDKTICISNGMQLLSGIPAGGSWSGVAVNGNNFDPVLAAAGSHNLVYSYTDSSGCAGSDTVVYNVLANPVVFAGNDTFVCKNKLLTLTGSPQNGTWKMGSGIIGNVFNPASLNTGIYTLTYNYTDANGCFAKDTLIINVKAFPTVDAGTDTSLCANGGSFYLAGLPAGGSWSGPGTTGNIFDPTGLSGFKTITYLYVDPNGCDNTDSRGITVKTLPAVNAGNDRNVCLDAGSISLNGTPSSGVWNGTGVTGGMFDPAVAGLGVHPLMYRAAGINGCSVTDTLLLTVVKPVAGFSATPLTGSRPLAVSFTDITSGNHQLYEWNFGDAGSSQNTSGLQNPSHTYSQQGIYSVKLKITDTTINCSDTLTKVNYINVSYGLGVIEISGSKDIYAYPNPASKTFDLLINVPGDKTYSLVINDISGRRVRMLSELKTGVTHINCEGLEQGIYLIELFDNRGCIFKTKIVLQ